MTPLTGSTDDAPPWWCVRCGARAAPAGTSYCRDCGPAAVLAPARRRLAEALACVDDGAGAEFWRQNLAAYGPGGLRIRENPRAAMAGSVAGWHLDARLGYLGANARTPWTYCETEPRAAWERACLAGLAPAEDADARVFDCDDRAATTAKCRACGALDAEHPMPHPPTLATVVALAADPRGVATAEALARELVARLAPWGAPRPARAAWRAVDARAWGWTIDRVAALRVASEATPHAAENYDGAVALERRLAERFDAPLADAMARVALDRDDWECAARDGRRVGEGIWTAQGLIPRALLGAPFADLANPFAPLVALWESGYALHRIGTDAVTLVFPAIGGGST